MQQPKKSFQVIHGGASEKPAGSPRELLKRVLEARLTPTLTIEDACHLRIPDVDGELPSMEQFLEDVNLLRDAGLEVRIQLDDLPEGIVLADPSRFIARFPELSDAVPVMLAHEGVQPYTDGFPRRLHPVRRGQRVTELRLV